MEGFFIGTYTEEGSEGIYHALFNPENGELSALRLAGTSSNPSYLALDPENRRLYAVNEMVPGQDMGTVTAFSIDDSSRLSPIQTVSTGGAYPCYISLSQDGRSAFIANYGGGNVSHISVGGESTMEVESVLEHHGSGPHPNQAEPHAHYIRQMDGTDIVLSADLGTDKVYQYRMSQDSLVLMDSVLLNPGSGPRHIDFHPRLPVMYVINELNSTIAVFSYNKSNNKFKEIQLISTLPDNYKGESYCADIHVHPDGTFLYGSNRGHDSIVSYRIGDDGMLEMTGHFTEGVAWPRNFAISPDSGYLLIANQRGNSVITARIDEKTGRLSEAGGRLEVSQPVCIKF